MMKRLAFFIGAVLASACAATSARGQAVPFFFPGATAFTPEVSIVNTGIVHDVQAVVSADRKYVTLNMRPANSSLLALREFQFQQPQAALGFVGDPRPAVPVAADANDAASAVPTSPSAILNATRASASLLQRTGMIRVGSLPR